MTTPSSDFARVLADAGEPPLAELPLGDRAVAEIRAAIAEDYARRKARWDRNAEARRAGWAAYVRAAEEAGTEHRDPGEVGWMCPPTPPITF